MKRTGSSILALGCAIFLGACGGGDDATPLGSTGGAGGDGGGGNAGAASDDPNLDNDGDGRTNGEEIGGYEILVDSGGFGLGHPNFLERRDVTSDPNIADTDDDGLNDGEEYLAKADPRNKDTDGDGLSDSAEVTRWMTSVVSVDTDGDANGDPDNPVAPVSQMFDGAELALIDDPREPGHEIPGPSATSPLLSDTDGDGVTDLDEVTNPVRNSTVAELPEVAIEIVDPVDVRLNIEYADELGTEKSYGSEFTSTESSELSRADGTSTSHSTQHSETVSAEVEAKWLPGVKVKAEYTQTTGTETSVSTEVTKTSAEEFSRASSQFRAESASRTISTEGGSITMGLRATNTGAIAYELRDLGITVRQFLISEGRHRSLTALQLPDGFDSFALSPGADTGVIPFASSDLDAGLVKELLENPTSLILEPAGYELVNADGTNFVFLTEDTFARTALIVIDYGDGTVDRLRVATNVNRDDEGAFTGVRLERALGDANVDFQVATGANGDEVLAQISSFAPAQHVGTAGKLGDPAYPAGKEPGPRMAHQFWTTFAARETGEVDLEGDFGAVRIRPRDEIHLVLWTDDDRDGVFAREEFVRGSSDSSIHSDATDALPTGDGLSDYYEIRVGWEVTVVGDNAPPPYQAFPSPVLIDSNGDGLDDDEELALGTDPNKPDTDGDSVSDYDEVHVGWTVYIETEYYANEYQVFSNPVHIDTDGDGLDDAEEAALGTDPNKPDTDGDGEGDATDPKPREDEYPAIP